MEGWPLVPVVQGEFNITEFFSSRRVGFVLGHC